MASILVLFVAFAYVNSLWSQQYLQYVESQWELAPIVDVILSEQNSNVGSCPEGYEIATSGDFAGLYAGCDCTQSRNG